MASSFTVHVQCICVCVCTFELVLLDWIDVVELMLA